MHKSPEKGGHRGNKKRPTHKYSVCRHSAVENKQPLETMTKVRALSLVSREEKAAGDGGDGGDGGGHEFDIHEIGSRFTPAALAEALKPHSSSGPLLYRSVLTVLYCAVTVPQ